MIKLKEKWNLRDKTNWLKFCLGSILGILKSVGKMQFKIANRAENQQ